ncbi:MULTISPECIES: efflux transporter outer membrane subunit [unclassified Sphingomonas]|uniref:efflux transporter outer membrane subunit n=1 Tax=unclassified Sphingomonas TaxID=196159 RepID=UPI0006F5DA77|nr:MULTISPECIES: efflux transporter outer membrane subunit [unclassified Sphingomonas]KQX18234.1 RND transporter [Sphingomonas sp. Root1294]KQY72719.1 RND transporter [Sphingomonas sp. Root50]KRB87794.1 RND transporter [Sphingomonas sp. Root720]
MRVPLWLVPMTLLAGCTVGPDYRGPTSAGAASPPAAFVRAPGDVAAQAPQAAAWWTALGDPVLDELEQRALAGSPSVAIAQARLNQARSALGLERANALPKANASAVYLHARVPGLDLGSSDGSGEGGADGGGGDEEESLSVYNVGFDASWEIDLFGGQRRNVEAARASLGAAEANVADARVSLAAEVAQAYVALRDRQQRLALARESVEKQRAIYALTAQRRERGAASALDVERQRSQVEQSRAAELPIGAEYDAYRNALATLTGEVPGALDALLAEPRAVPLPPAEVAVGDPAALLRRRPDVRAAERKLAASTAKIGAAKAAAFPRLSFMGIIGLGGTSIGDVVDPDKLAAIVAPQLSWNFLDFGRNAARVGQAEGARDEAAAQYRSSVLAALRDAEDALSRYGARRQAVATAARSKASADTVAAIAGQRFGAGTATRIELLDAERQRIAADQSLIQAKAEMTTDFIALEKALGLGWE